jgi:hypothetical protein
VSGVFDAAAGQRLDVRRVEIEEMIRDLTMDAAV